MRYAKEILKGIDKICKKDEFVLVVPEYAEHAPELENIKIVSYGKRKGNMWEQTDFVRFLKKAHLESVNFNNTMPLFRPGIIVIHDIAYKLHPEFGSSLHGKISNVYHRIIFKKAAKSRKQIITVSRFSKYQIVDAYKVDPKRIHVIGNAWQHINSFDYDDSIFENKKIKKGEYYFSLGSISKMKNTGWILELARNNPDKTFVLSGAKAYNSKVQLDIPDNVVMTGFVSDEQIKSLIKGCKAFVYPSIYDGFGIPPLEALSQGVPVICSSAACLPEIYKNSVHYIDPYDTDVNIDELLKEEVDSPEAVLNRYSWSRSAEEFYALLKKQGC